MFCNLNFVLGKHKMPVAMKQIMMGEVHEPIFGALRVVITKVTFASHDFSVRIKRLIVGRNLNFTIPRCRNRAREPHIAFQHSIEQKLFFGVFGLRWMTPEQFGGRNRLAPDPVIFSLTFE